MLDRTVEITGVQKEHVVPLLAVVMRHQPHHAASEQAQRIASIGGVAVLREVDDYARSSLICMACACCRLCSDNCTWTSAWPWQIA